MGLIKLSSSQNSTDCYPRDGCRDLPAILTSVRTFDIVHIHLCIHPFTYLPIHSPIHPFIYLFHHTSIYPSTHPPTHPSIHPSLHPFTDPSVHPLSHLSISSNHSLLPLWLSGKESTCQCQRHRRYGFNPWVGKIPWRRKWQPTPVFLPGKFHG